MRWSLFLLILGQCLFLVCPLRYYFFIEEQTSWEEAQRYCRGNYTDLATVYGMNDTQTPNDSVREAWIGLRNEQENKVWHWSQPGVKATEKGFWADSEPNDHKGVENCVVIKNNEWHDDRCSHEHVFICYDEKQSNDQYIIHGWKNWSEAQKHCREEHTDLVSGLDQLLDKNLRRKIKTHENSFYYSFWIGLFRDSWRWSDGSNASFRNWESFKDDNSEKCAVTLLPSQKWDSRPCGEKKHFFCYKEGNMFLFKENKTWNEAQKYCRENYTDLATVHGMNDTQRLNDSLNTDEAWIGLRNVPGKHNRVWHWSRPGVEVTGKEFWAKGQPNNSSHRQNCVVLNRNGWNDIKCSDKRSFICYDDKKPSDEQYIFHNGKKTWSEAQKHCREKHTDLVSVLDQLQYRNLRSKTNKHYHKNRFFWIGLFRDSWRWSDGSKASFSNWESFKDDNSKRCAVTLLPSQKWDSRDCDEKKPFFCYKEENMILIKEAKTWEEASDYCIENHRGLVSITNSSQQKWAAKKAKEAETDHVWVGLRYTCVLDLWFWVNDELVCYKNWASDQEPVEGCDRAVAMSRGGEHKWHTKADTEKFNFICALH